MWRMALSAILFTVLLGATTPQKPPPRGTLGAAERRQCQLRGGFVERAGRLGFERCILYATGMANIRDVIPFPRAPGQAAF